MRLNFTALNSYRHTVVATLLQKSDNLIKSLILSEHIITFQFTTIESAVHQGLLKDLEEMAFSKRYWYRFFVLFFYGHVAEE